MFITWNGMGIYRGSLNLKTAKALGIARPTSVLLERTADAQFVSGSVGYNLRLVLAWLRIILRVFLLALFQTFTIRPALKPAS